MSVNVVLWRSPCGQLYLTEADVREKRGAIYLTVRGRTGVQPVYVLSWGQRSGYWNTDSSDFRAFRLRKNAKRSLTSWTRELWRARRAA